MATSKRRFALSAAFALSACVCAALGNAAPREAASPAACQAAGNTKPIADDKAALDANPDNLRSRFALADAWSDAGCFSDALRVLQTAAPSHPANPELQTRIRVARSLIGEEHYFDNLNRAGDDARVKHAAFRCTALSDLGACGEAVHLRPDDPSLLTAQGDAFARAKRPADAAGSYRRAAALAPPSPELTAKLEAVAAQLKSASGETPDTIAITSKNEAQPSGSANGAASSVTPNSSSTGASVAGAAVNSSPHTRVAARPSQGARVIASARQYSNVDPEARSH